MTHPLITIVVAMNKDMVIGTNNQLPWHITEDLQHFKQVTLGKPIIMGRKTFESIGRVLPGRKNIIVSRNPNVAFGGVTIYNSLTKAIEENSENSELCIIGGGTIYAQALPLTDIMYITEVDMLVLNPTTYFPAIDWKEWQLVSSKGIITKDNLCCCFKKYHRIK